MMILGEVVLELGIPPYKSNQMDEINSFAFCGMLLSFAFGIQYYDCVHRNHGHPHAMQRSAFNAFVFTWMHPIIGYAMLLTSIASTRIYHQIHVDADSIPRSYRALLAWACAAVVAVLTFTRLLHKGILHASFSPLYQCRVVFLVAHILVQYSALDYTYDIVIHALLALALALLDLLAMRIKQDMGWHSEQSMNLQKILDHQRHSLLGAPLLPTAMMPRVSSSASLDPSTKDSIAGEQPMSRTNSLPVVAEGGSTAAASTLSMRHGLSLSDSLYVRRLMANNGPASIPPPPKEDPPAVAT